MNDQTWRRLAACAGKPTAWWFPESELPEAYDRPRSICVECPVRTQCDDWATITRQSDGMFGGHTPAQRRTRVRRRNAQLRKAS